MSQYQLNYIRTNEILVNILYVTSFEAYCCFVVIIGPVRENQVASLAIEWLLMDNILSLTVTLLSGNYIIFRVSYE
ncbi:hypothetical protein D3C85_1198260 [compost metagenome]